MKLFRALKVRKGQLLWYTFLTSQLTNWSGQIMTRRDQWLYPKMWLFHSESTGAGDFVEEDDAQAERVPFDLAFMWWSSKKWWTEWFHAEQLLPPGPLFERIIWHKWLGDNFFFRFKCHDRWPRTIHFILKLRNISTLEQTALEFKLPLARWKWMMRMITSYI